MIVGIGIDYVEVERIAELLERHPGRFVDRVFTPAERAECEGRAEPAFCYAGRFAAKEAFVKALGTGVADGIVWRDVEVTIRDGGQPALAISGRALDRMRERGGSIVHVSFSHDGGRAVAVVVIEG